MVEGKHTGGKKYEGIKTKRKLPVDPHLSQLFGKGGSLKVTDRPTSGETVFTNLSSPHAKRKLVGEKRSMKSKYLEKFLGRKYKQVDVSSIAMSTFGEDSSPQLF